MTNYGYNKNTYCTNAFGGFDSWAGAVCCKVYPRKPGASFYEIINSEVTKHIQKDLLNGIQSSYCKECWQQEKHGVKSLRINQTFMQLIDQEAEQIHWRNIIKEEIYNKKIRNFTINSGNMCNLACRTCHPNLSSGHWNESEYKNSTNKYPKIIFKPKVEKTSIDLLLKEDYSSIQNVQILGGEPFLNLDHLAVIEKIIQDGNAKNCTLTYTTNMTVKLPEKIKNIAKNFKRIVLMMSLDATGKPFSYIRTTGDWQIVKENLRNLLLVAKEYNLNLNINVALSVLNLLYLEEIYKLAEIIRNKITYCDVQLQFVTDPKHYSANILKDTEKDKIIQLLLNSESDLQPIVSYVKQSVFCPSSRQRFFEEIEFTKQYRGLDIYEYLPELMSLLD